MLRDVDGKNIFFQELIKMQQNKPFNTFLSKTICILFYATRRSSLKWGLGKRTSHPGKSPRDKYTVLCRENKHSVRSLKLCGTKER